MSRRALCVVPWGFPVLVAFGCARAETAADRHAAEMRDAISRLEVDRDRTDQRLGALEVAVAEDKSRPKKKPAAAAAPSPKVVQLGEGPARGESDDPEDTAERPAIKVVGPPGAARASTSRAQKSRTGNVDTSMADAPQPSVLDPEAKRAYEDAIALVNGKQYDRALEALAGFLVKWPDHPYAENAHYWRGEVYFAQGEYLRAAEQFEAALAQRGGGAKAPDALLKLGMCHARLGSNVRAEEYWERLRRDYPKSDAARKSRDVHEVRKGAARENR